MKIITTIFFLLIESFFHAQKTDSLDIDNDGILNSDDWCPTLKGIIHFNGCPNPKPDCTNFQLEKKALYDAFKTESENIDYSKLPELIFEALDLSKINKKNVLLSPLNTEGYECGTSLLYNCTSDYNVINPNFSADNFLNSEIIKNFSIKLKANIIPCISTNNFSSDWQLDLYETRFNNYFSNFKLEKFDDLIMSNANIGNVVFDNEQKKIYYFKYKNQKLNISDVNYLMLDFKNKLNYIVTIHIYYNKEKVAQILQFQYKQKKWIRL